MLTKSDLNNIAEIVDEKINKAIDTRIPKIINQTVPQIVDNKIQKALKSIKSDISKIKRNLDSTIDLFDNDYLEVKKRVKRIEQHLNLPE